jgi:hypothetical protein
MERLLPRTLLVLAGYCCAFLLNAQARNANWLAGCWLSFNAAGTDINPLPANALITRKSISTSDGQLYLTVGGDTAGADFGIHDGAFQIIDNHPPMDAWIYNIHESTALFMPVPGHPERMFLFFHRNFSPDVRKYGWIEIGPDGPGGQLRMTDIGMQYFMLNPSIKCTGIAHANGEDYWFLTQSVGSNEVHVFRIGDQGVEEGPIISPGGTIITDQNRSGFMVGSVQGNFFVSQTWDFSLINEPTFELYAFDAAIGQANLQHTFENLTGEVWGVEFSPSERYLYILRGEMVGSGHRHTLYQYDLEAPDVEASRVVVDTHDFAIGGSNSITNNLCLGPDGRIYGNRHPSSYLSIIQNPDEAAPACNYVEDGLALGGCVVEVPLPLKYYHDDAALGVTAVESPSLRVWPNPVMEQGVVSGVGDGKIQLRWCDALGRVIQEGTSLAQDGRVTLDVQALPSGAYVLNVTPKNGMPAAVRVSVMH